ncbi:MAG: carboxypeptidase-like regulatory domain-containing protein [Prevotella sp.]|nr:carboxypeptidase-like regulatory domain-containing protein [Prevotella sp.]
MTMVLLSGVLLGYAQAVINGVVLDRQTGRTLSHVSVTAEGGKEHTVTNDDGRFSLKTQRIPQYIQLSHIGYKTRRQQIQHGQTSNLRIMMAVNTVGLHEVVVTRNDPLEIVKDAMDRIEKNYPQQPELVRCFYRETARRGSRFISVAEAVTDMYKTSYSRGPERDAVAILKGRRLMSMKARDTLGVKIQGGPVMPLMVDIAKNREYVLKAEDFGLYDFSMDMPALIDDRLQYVVSMQPKMHTMYPLMYGKLFIDQETLAFTRAELQLDVSNWRSASDYMLVKKPFGLRFRPKELTVTIVYTTDMQGVTRMSYVRNEMRFNCDWKRRLFASPFTTVSEMVVTDRRQMGEEVKRPKGRNSFGIRERFYDKVEYFEDPDFWADYNIIEPTESLENAIGKLKKKARKQ